MFQCLEVQGDTRSQVRVSDLCTDLGETKPRTKSTMKKFLEFLAFYLASLLAGGVLGLGLMKIIEKVGEHDHSTKVHVGEIWETNKKSDPFDREPPTQYFVTGIAIGSDGRAYVEYYNTDVGPNYRHSYELSWFLIGTHRKTPAQ